MKLKDILTDIKTYIILFLFIIGIGVSVTGWAKLPEKVKDIEKKTEATDDKVQSVAQTLETYIATQEVRDKEKAKAEEEKEKLMMKWIEAVSKK